jgi:hypothetical protein
MNHLIEIVCFRLIDDQKKKQDSHNVFTSNEKRRHMQSKIYNVVCQAYNLNLLGQTVT